MLDHAALVREQRNGARCWTRGAAGAAAIRKVTAWVGARLVGSLLDDVSVDVTWGPPSAAAAKRTEAMELEAEGSGNVSDRGLQAG